MALRIKTTLVADGTVTPYDTGTGSQPDPSVAGSPPQWGDDSDGSYALFHGIAHTNNPNFSDGANGFTGPHPSLEVGTDALQVNLRMRVSGSGHDCRIPNLALQGNPGTNTRLAYWGGDPMPPGPTWVTFPMVTAGGYSLMDTLIALRDTGLYIESRAVWGPDPGFTYSNSWTIYEVRFDVMVEVTGPAPAARKFPREDGLGVGSGRHFPPSKSQQRSGRRFGYY